MEPREIAELRDKAAHMCLDLEVTREPVNTLDVHVSYWHNEAEKALGELVAVLNERLRNKEVK